VGELDHAAHGTARRKRAEVAGAVVRGSAHNEDPGERLGGDLEVGVALVVAEAGVEPGAVFLDEGILEDERVLLRPGHDHLQVARLAHEEPHLGRESVGGLEVGADPVAKRGGLPDVEDRPVPAAEQVHPRGLGEVPHLRRKVFVGHDRPHSPREATDLQVPPHPLPRGAREGPTAPQPRVRAVQCRNPVSTLGVLG